MAGAGSARAMLLAIPPLPAGRHAPAGSTGGRAPSRTGRSSGRRNGRRRRPSRSGRDASRSMDWRSRANRADQAGARRPAAAGAGGPAAARRRAGAADRRRRAQPMPGGPGSTSLVETMTTADQVARPAARRTTACRGMPGRADRRFPGAAAGDPRRGRGAGRRPVRGHFLQVLDPEEDDPAVRRPGPLPGRRARRRTSSSPAGRGRSAPPMPSGWPSAAGEIAGICARAAAGASLSIDTDQPPRGALLWLYMALRRRERRTMIGPVAFAAPWLLLALPALPVLWWLLRVTPPAPRRIAFPAIRLLRGLPIAEETPGRARPGGCCCCGMVAAALVILALARPVLDPASAARPARARCCWWSTMAGPPRADWPAPDGRGRRRARPRRARGPAAPPCSPPRPAETGEPPRRHRPDAGRGPARPAGGAAAEALGAGPRRGAGRLPGLARRRCGRARDPAGSATGVEHGAEAAGSLRSAALGRRR